MEKDLNRIYQRKDQRKKHLLHLRNRYFAIIYGNTLRGVPVRKIHKALFDETINRKPQYADKALLAMAIKAANKAKKIDEDDSDLLALAIFNMFKKAKLPDKSKKIINHDVGKEAEEEKDDLLNQVIDQARKQGKWFYLASSHDDCAEDHIPYQGRLYVDENAPDSAIGYAKSRGLLTMQWVVGGPAWFITRPNCRHYFVPLTEADVRGQSLKKLKKRHKTHKKEGDRDLQTPASAALEEYQDRLEYLKGLYKEYPTEELEKEIIKTEILVKKWKETS